MMMQQMLLPPLLALLLLAAPSHAASCGEGVDASFASWEPPAFCHGHDCPKYKVVETKPDLERRRYVPATWVTTNVSGMNFDDATTTGYKRLMDYATGANKDKMKLETTTPYFTLLYPTGKERTVDSFFTVELFIPFRLQDSPPEPEKEELDFVVLEKEQEVWVEAFGGFAKGDDVIRRGFDLMERLKKEGHDVVEKSFGFAQYDSAARVVGRHNEIHVWARSKAKGEVVY